MVATRPSLASGLHWVRSEIEQCLQRVRAQLEEAMEDAAPAALQTAAGELRQVLGTTTLVQCAGASLLAREMLATTEALIAAGAELAEREAALGALLGATLQLGDYLDALGHGAADCALVLQALINELRLARAAAVLTEAELFAEQLGEEAAALPLPAGRDAAVAAAAARRYLPAAQQAMLQWIKNDDARTAVARLGKIAEQLAQSAAGEPAYRLWRVLAGTAEAVLGRGLEDSLELKRLCGRAVQQIKRTAEAGEDEAAAGIGTLDYQLLFHVGRSRAGGPRVVYLRRAFELDRRLPAPAELDAFAQKLRGPNTQLLQRLADEIRRDLAQVKDSIDLVVRAGSRALADLNGSAARLRGVASTLGMLGLVPLQRVLQQQCAAVERLRQAGGDHRSEWMDVATALLRVENSLDAALFRQLRRGGIETGPAAQYDEATPPAADFDEGVDALLRESLVNLAKFKSATDLALRQGSREGLPSAAGLLGEIGAGLRIVDDERAAKLLAELLRYVEQPGFPAAVLVQGQAERFADAVACVEFYLEALQSRSPDAERLLDELAGYIARLDFVEGGRLDTALPQAAAPSTEGERQLDDVDPEIRDIFVEEAGEVLETLRAQLGPWQRDPADGAGLLELRRAFHTLKGSGRMVGATHIAEFAWACENLLNHCRDGALSVDDSVLQLVGRAVELLPQLIERFRDHQPAPAGAGELIAGAQALCRRAAMDRAEMLGVFREDARGHLQRIRAWVETQDRQAAAYAVDGEVLRGLHTLRGSAAVVDHGAVSALSGALERYLETVRRAGQQMPPPALRLLDEALSVLGEWLEATPPPPADAAEPWRSRIAAVQQSLPDEAVEAVSRQQLVDLFTHEAFERVQEIENTLAAWQRQPEAAAHARTACSLFQTLRAASEAARCTALVKVAAAFEARLGAFVAGAAPAPAFFEGASAIIEGIYQILDAFRDGRLDEDGSALVARIAALDGAAPPVAPEPAGAAGRDVGDGGLRHLAAAQTRAAETRPAAAGRDPELVDIFVAEADELLASIEQGFDDWQARPAQEAPEAAVLRALHTFKGSARMAGFDSVGEVGHRLETLVESARTMPRDAAFFARLANVVDGLHHGLDEIRRGLEPQLASLFVELEGEDAPEPAPPSSEPQDDRGAPAQAPEPAPPASLAAAAPVEQSAPAELPAAPPPAPVPAAEEDEAELLQVFRAEAAEQLEQMEAALAAWRGDPAAPAPLQDLQRVLHTLKGGARMAGLSAMGAAVHEMESLVEDVSGGELAADELAFEQLQTRCEQLQHMHDRLVRGEALAEDQAQPIEAPYDWPPPLEAATPAAAAPTLAGTAPAGTGVAPQSWDPQLFWRPEDEYGARQQQRRELARVPVERLDALLNAAGEMSIQRSRLEQRNVEMESQLAEMAATVRRVREQLRRLDIETEAQIAARGLLQSPGQGGEDRYGPEFDPLEMDRYSRMQELSRALGESVGDLASLHGSLVEIAEDAGSQLQQQGRINTELQQGLMATLMVPFSRQVARLQRVVRQTAAESGRQVELRFEGVESELDRNVLERMTAPLEHLLRNAVVHGIEPPIVRGGFGKRETGEIVVALQREGTQLRIEVRDDGRGLDIAAIRAQAVARGLMPETLELSALQIAQFIFEPGFSTARELTQSAGRGVGMDVVAAEVKQLGGTLDLETEAGAGTRFVIRLPLTLAVSQTLLIGVGSELYAVPLSSIEGIARVPRGQLDQYFGDPGASLPYGGAHYPLRYLGDYLGIPFAGSEDSRTVPVILVRVPEGIAGAERRMGLVVDALHGNREVVSKAVGPQVSSIVGITGATILADGAVVLILDVPALVQDRTRRALLAEAGGGVTAREEKRATIMVVDDSVTMRRVAERLLSRHGFRVVTARDGLDAMAQLATESPSVILLDIEMPRADGFEVAAFVRNSERIGSVPIIMITSRSGDKHRQRARELGVDRYLIKPYQEDQLLAQIAELMPA